MTKFPQIQSNNMQRKRCVMTHGVSASRGPTVSSSRALPACSIPPERPGSQQPRRLPSSPVPPSYRDHLHRPSPHSLSRQSASTCSHHSPGSTVLSAPLMGGVACLPFTSYLLPQFSRVSPKTKTGGHLEIGLKIIFLNYKYNWGNRL